MLRDNFDRKQALLLFVVRLIFICSFIIPTFALDNIGFPVTNFFFIISISICYLLLIETVSVIEIIFVTSVLILVGVTKNIDMLHFISIVTLFKLMKYKDQIKKILLKDKIVYISLWITLFYIALYFGADGRWIHTSIKEVNMSGLALFCLALIIRKRSVFIGNSIFLIGLFTLSRNYLLAIVVLILLNLKFIKNHFVTNKLIKNTTFFKVFLISSIILIMVAFYFEYLFAQGQLSDYTLGFKRFFNFKDFSNYFRFTANKYVLTIFINEPKFLFTGIPYDDFYIYSAQIASNTGQLYRNTNAHNFFFSYLRLYGAFSIFVIAYISRILSKIINKNNYGVYFSFLMYALFLGVGFNLYWLYLIVFVLILYGGDSNNENTIG